MLMRRIRRSASEHTLAWMLSSVVGVVTIAALVYAGLSALYWQAYSGEASSARVELRR